MNKICELFNIKYPVIQGGMVWCSGWELASAVSNNGGLGLLGAGSMRPEILEEHIQKTKQATSFSYGVNVPLLYPEIEKIMEIIIRNKVPIVFTSAGSPGKWTETLQKNNIKVAHVVSSSVFAKKCEDAGVDAIVAEGFEAGGHNGREETTTLTLIPQVRKCTRLPLLAAGGVSSGESMLAAMLLGADGVQIGTRFALSEESSAHPDFKKLLISIGEGGTKLALKKLAPTRLVKNRFFEEVDLAEKEGKSVDEMKRLLGKGRARKGMFEGDLISGELEIGQVSAQINEIIPVEQLIKKLLAEFHEAKNEILHEKYNF